MKKIVLLSGFCYYFPPVSDIYLNQYCWTQSNKGSDQDGAPTPSWSGFRLTFARNLIAGSAPHGNRFLPSRQSLPSFSRILQRRSHSSTTPQDLRSWYHCRGRSPIQSRDFRRRYPRHADCHVSVPPTAFCST